MSTASAPSRFWGVVAIALNSVLQPAGQICGGTDSPALRLSPLFQIANAISLIHHSIRLSFAIGLPFRSALGVVAERARLYEKRSGITEPERHFYFRALVFIFGALPTTVKALAVQGDLVSRYLVLGFLVPFLVLESIERLAKRPTLARLAEATHRMPVEKNTGVIVFRLMAAIFALAFHIDLCLETMKLALMKSMFEAKLFEMNKFIGQFSPLIAFFVPVSLRIYESGPKDARPLVLILLLIINSTMLLPMAITETIRMWGRWSEIATTILAIAVAIMGTLAHLFVYLRFTSTTLRQLFSGENLNRSNTPRELFSGGNWHRQKFMEQWIALWTVTCIFLYYGYLYDASGTYKPAWTEWLP